MARPERIELPTAWFVTALTIKAVLIFQRLNCYAFPQDSGASADKSLCSAAEALTGDVVSDGKQLEIRHFCLAACGFSFRQGVFAVPKSLDAPEPSRLAA
jgi:hypothetical protein